MFHSRRTELIGWRILLMLLYRCFQFGCRGCSFLQFITLSHSLFGKFIIRSCIYFKFCDWNLRGNLHQDEERIDRFTKQFAFGCRFWLLLYHLFSDCCLLINFYWFCLQNFRCFWNNFGESCGLHCVSLDSMIGHTFMPWEWYVLDVCALNTSFATDVARAGTSGGKVFGADSSN